MEIVLSIFDNTLLMVMDILIKLTDNNREKKIINGTL